MNISLLIVMCVTAMLAKGAEPAVLEALDVDHVWAGHPVGFALLTHGDKQFVAYYDANRAMQVAWRNLGDAHWDRVALPEKLGWDSHNFVTMAVDSGGYVHLSGNMHVAPLVYFRTREPGNPRSFERAPMVGTLEDHVTYPRFFRGANQTLIFTYRDGRSGSGDQIFNSYDVAGRKWSRLLDKPLTTGMGKMNAYFDGPRLGPDGRFHLCWVWRNTSDCATNHDPCYARSTDLVHWETSAGHPLELPITIDTAEIIDPIPPGCGIINGNIKLGFDSNKQPVVSYIKYDANGNTQVYNARVEDGAWRIRQASDWTYRWAFSGGGSIPFEIGISAIKPHEPGRLFQSYRHAKLGSGAWLLDEVSLKPLGPAEPPRGIPNDLAKPLGDFPGLSVQFADDLGAAEDRASRYVLRWETLGPNRDRPRDGDLPPPAVLSVIKLGGLEKHQGE